MENDWFNTELNLERPCALSVAITIRVEMLRSNTGESKRNYRERGKNVKNMCRKKKKKS